MANRRKKPNLPKKLIQGKTGKSQEARPPAVMGKGQIVTNLKPINWTPSKLTITLFLLGTPYLIAIIASFRAGINLIGIILIGLAVFMGLIYLALRFIEKGDF